jgi:hypothetical protein
VNQKESVFFTAAATIFDIGRAESRSRTRRLHLASIAKAG